MVLSYFFSHSFLFILFLLSARTPPLHNCSQALKMLFFRFRQTVERKGKGGIIMIGGKWVWVWRYHSIIVQTIQTETERVKYALLQLKKDCGFRQEKLVFVCYEERMLRIWLAMPRLSCIEIRLETPVFHYTSKNYRMSRLSRNCHLHSQLLLFLIWSS